jgi:hypothetical protein
VPTLVLSGTYMTSLNGPGFSITLLKATPEMIGYLEAPTNAAGWGALNVGHLHNRPTTEVATQIDVDEDHAKATGSSRIACKFTTSSLKLQELSAKLYISPSRFQDVQTRNYSILPESHRHRTTYYSI